MRMCVFCAIVDGSAAASFVHQDELCVAFMNLRPIHPGDFIVIPRAHVDHFTDLDDQLAAHILTIAQRYARGLLSEFGAVRVGYVVHGFGVPHAHLNVVAQHGPLDIISDRHIVAPPGSYEISEAQLPIVPRANLDAHAARLVGAVS